MEPRPKLIRLARVTAGFTLLPVGVALLVLPGPGIPLVVGGLALLESEFQWAGRARRQLGNAAESGRSWLLRARRKHSSD
jgi:hypothetical protein